MTKVIGLALFFVGTAGYVFGGFSTPEIDASSGTAAVALLTGGMVVLWGRRRAR